MAVRNVEYIQYIYNDQSDASEQTLGYFVPEIALLVNFREKIIQKLQTETNQHAELIQLLQDLPGNGFFKAQSMNEDKLRRLLSNFQRTKGLYDKLDSAGIPLPGAVQSDEVSDYVTGSLPQGVTVERRTMQVKYNHKPHTFIEKWLPKLAYVAALFVAVGLAVLTAEAVAAAGWATGFMISVGVGTLLSRFTHVIKTFESKLERVGRAYSRWQSGLYGDLSWGNKLNLFGATFATGTFLTGLYWTFTKTLEVAMKKFSYPLAMLYAAFTVIYAAGSVLDPVWAQFGITKTRPFSAQDQSLFIQEALAVSQHFNEQLNEKLTEIEHVLDLLITTAKVESRLNNGHVDPEKNGQESVSSIVLPLVFRAEHSRQELGSCSPMSLSSQSSEQEFMPTTSDSTMGSPRLGVK